ncbi:MAG: bifunctional biotin--[acetyl-CoA-carboxylase] ligase/biotin operon repressor BirA [Gammaproteobacteria bacterium]|jgi:BirA family biotin operon repressor/biotin-[acetyl-CoA-carboxylase] ligase
MGKDAQILAILADGQFHSGQELANQLGLSRSGVWKVIQGLQARGVEVFAVQGKGYRLSQPVELLDKDIIAHTLAGLRDNYAGDISVLWDVDSTNRYLTQKVNSHPIAGATCLAETQSDGRGRRGRNWVSPLGGNIYLSQLWRFNTGPAHLSGLSLAAAIAVVRVIRQLGAVNVGLKWPNDILLDGKKLAGILLEMHGESNGPTNVVVGVGINVRLPATAADQIDQPYISLSDVMNRAVERNKLAAHLISHLMYVYELFSERGFAAFIEEWSSMDVYHDKRVQLQLPSGTISGINRGVDPSGALRVEHEGQITSYPSGELSLRAV